MRRLEQLTLAAFACAAFSTAAASDTPPPTSVTIAGTMQSELGCPDDWQPACAQTHLLYDPDDDVWQGIFNVPAGTWEYKAALDDSWDENYGANAQRNGANLSFTLGATAAVKLYYDHETHWVTDSASSVIATAVGSFQSELGCASDWDPGCLRSWLEDPDGDGTYTFEAYLPAGSYEAKVAISEGWAENYGAGGVPNGANIPFTVTDPTVPVAFRYDAASHVLEISGGAAPYEFAGFLPPVRNPPAVNAARAGNDIRLKFSLGGDRGLAVLEPGSPTSVQRTCPGFEPVQGAAEQAVAGELTYAATHDQYVFRWATEAAWAGTCRELLMILDDGSVHAARFQFVR
jgi:hypothetical protein